MDNSKNNFVKHVMSVCIFMLFCYLMVVINVYKATKKIEFNVFKSYAAKDFLVFFAVALPLFIALKYVISILLKNKKVK